MPKSAVRRTNPTTLPPIEVRLSEREGVRVGREILGMADPARRAKVLKEFERILSAWANALANVPNAGLRSDLLARARPLAARAETFWKAMHREPDVLTFASFKEFIDVNTIGTQLQGFLKLVEWINEEKSKRGGERRAFRKQRNEEWKAQVRLFLARHARRIPKAGKPKHESQLIRIAQAAVDRALRSHGAIE